MIDQVFWQYAAVLSDRLLAQQFAETIYPAPARVVRIGQERTGMLTLWLDKLVALSVDGLRPDWFYGMQALTASLDDSRVLAMALELAP